MAFPTVSVLDSLQRANEKPLSNGTKWVLLDSLVKTGEIKSEAWNATSAFGSEDGAYWKEREFGGAVGLALEYHGGLTNLRFTRLWCCVSSPGSGTLSGYVLKILGESSTKVKLLLEKVNAGTAETLKEKTTITVAVGDRLGIAVQSGVVTAWLKKGAGAWEQILEHSDSSYTKGYVGLSAQGNLHSWRNFEAGGKNDISQGLSTTQGQGATLTHSVTRSLSTTQASDPKLARTPARTLSVTQGQAATLEELVVRVAHEHTLEAGQGQGIALARSVARTLTRGQGQAVALTHSLTGTLTVGQEQEATLAGEVHETEAHKIERIEREEYEARGRIRSGVVWHTK